MRTRDLVPGASATSPLGLGCAELFSLPFRNDRRAVVDAAYDLGIRHFDTAPMYGFGASEPELGRFLRGRRHEATIATKFGIQPGPAGRLLRYGQAPLRAALRQMPKAKSGLRKSGGGPSTGIAGRALYRQIGYSPTTARTVLEHSLRSMRLDHLDVFLLHEPTVALLGDVDDLAEYLEQERAAGKIRAWGLAGELHGDDTRIPQQFPTCQIIQRPDDVLATSASERPEPTQKLITYGVLSRSLPLIANLPATAPKACAELKERWNFDPGDRSRVVGLLLRAALRRNPDGVVLYATTDTAHLSSAVAGATATAAAEEDEILAALRSAVGGANQGVGESTQDGVH